MTTESIELLLLDDCDTLRFETIVNKEKIKYEYEGEKKCWHGPFKDYYPHYTLFELDDIKIEKLYKILDKNKIRYTDPQNFD